MAIVRLNRQYNDAARFLLNQSFETKARSIELSEWKRFDGEYSDVYYTLIHEGEGIGAACYRNESNLKIKVNLQIIGENIADCKPAKYCLIFSPDAQLADKEAEGGRSDI